MLELVSSGSCRPRDEAAVPHDRFDRQLLDHFAVCGVRCCGVMLQDGLLFRCFAGSSRFLFLRTQPESDAFRTRVYTTDWPYEPAKVSLGEVCTPRSEPDAEDRHLRLVKSEICRWVRAAAEAVGRESFCGLPVLNDGQAPPAPGPGRSET